MTTGQSAGESASLGAFFRGMDRTEKRTFWACFWGYALDGLDFTVYPLLIGTLMVLWSVPPGMAGMAVTLALLASAIGGWGAGYLSDRIGRVRTLKITILWFTAASLLCAVAQNFEQLLVARTLLGIGFGGEWAAGAVLIGEVIRPEFRGRAVGCVQSSFAVGWGLAVAGQAILFTLVPIEIAWRLMFALGLVPGIILLWFISRHVEEPRIARTARRVEDDKTSILEIFRGPIAKTTALASVAFTGAQGGYYAINTWLPTFLKVDRGISVVGSTGYLAFQIAGSFVGYLVGAWFSDRFGRRPLFLTFSIAAAATVIAYTQLDFGNAAILYLGFPLGFFSSGYYSGMGAFLTELYPTHLRGSGQGFCYNFGRGVGALFPALIGSLSTSFSLTNLMSGFAVGAYALFFIATLALPETKGKVLHSD